MSSEPVYFYTVGGDWGDFSNFSRHGVEMGGQWWPTVEHYFQAQKFDDLAYREKIRGASDPKRAADLGRSRDLPLRSDWEDIKIGVMRNAVREKVRTHASVREQLLTTGTRDIVENAPGDRFWGCGADGTGQNWLGRILQEVRAEIAG